MQEDAELGGRVKMQEDEELGGVAAGSVWDNGE